MDKRGQVTIFVILGLIIVVTGIIIYFLISGVPTALTNDLIENPKLFIKECVEEDFINLIENISYGGGSLNPEGYKKYNGNKVQLLCATSAPALLCNIQKINLGESIEGELGKEIEGKIDSCFNELNEILEKKGYVVKLDKKEFIVEINAYGVELLSNTSLTISKEESKQFNNFNMEFNSKLYEMVGITEGILSFETIVGDANVYDFMVAYPDYIISKYRANDETKIYIIKNKNTKELFQFASKSVYYPAGMID